MPSRSIDIGPRSSCWIVSDAEAQVPAEVRLFCFPHAGASASVFVDWSRRLPRAVEVLAAQLPGRGARRSEPPASSIEEIVAQLAAETTRYAGTPFLFFGHSFGAVLAYELAQRLHGSDGPHPQAIVISSCPAPNAPPKRRFLLHELPAREFFLELGKLGGLPAEAATNKKLQDLIEPALRADIRCRELWSQSCRKAGPPLARLPVPLYPMGGTRDRFVSREDLEQWASYTTRMQAVALFEGGHFYFLERSADVTAALAEIATKLAGSRA